MEPQQLNQTPTPPQPVPSSSTSHSHKRLLILVLVLLFLLLGAIGVFAYQTYTSSIQTEYLPTPDTQQTISPTMIPERAILPTLVPFDKNGWKTYTNTAEGYSIQYPSTMYINQFGYAVVVSEEKNPAELHNTMAINSVDNYFNGKDAYEYIISWQEGYKQGIQPLPPDIVGELTTGNVIFVKTTNPKPTYNTLSYYTNNGKNLYSIAYYFEEVNKSNPMLQEKFDQILSTFRFLDDGELSSITYQSSAGSKFSLIIPSECMTKQESTNTTNEVEIFCKTDDFSFRLKPQSVGLRAGWMPEISEIPLDNEIWTRMKDGNLAIYTLGNNEYLIEVNYDTFSIKAEQFVENILESFARK